MAQNVNWRCKILYSFVEKFKTMSKEIENYLNSLSLEQREIVNEIRETVLAADPAMKEGIKWGSIAFYNKKNICGFRVAKAHVTLLFMEGALLKTPNILSGDGAKARTYKVSDKNEVDSGNIANLVRESISLGM
jgi:hypothetical protein